MLSGVATPMPHPFESPRLPGVSVRTNTNALNAFHLSRLSAKNPDNVRGRLPHDPIEWRRPRRT